MQNLTYYSGKIEAQGRKCFVNDTEVECPKNGGEGQTQAGSYRLDILPPNRSLEIRNDLVYLSILVAVILSFVTVALLKLRIYGKTLGEYLVPIWYFIAVCLFAVGWQYLYGLKMVDNMLALRISQWVWELAVLASAYKLSRYHNFSYSNMFFLGVLYSIIIHGTKVTIRYFFYQSTFWYMIDRFLYGSLIVMAIAFVLGSVLVYLNKKKLNRS